MIIKIVIEGFKNEKVVDMEITLQALFWTGVMILCGGTVIFLALALSGGSQ